MAATLGWSGGLDRPRDDRQPARPVSSYPLTTSTRLRCRSRECPPVGRWLSRSASLFVTHHGGGRVRCRSLRLHALQRLTLNSCAKSTRHQISRHSPTISAVGVGPFHRSRGGTPPSADLPIRGRARRLGKWNGRGPVGKPLRAVRRTRQYSLRGDRRRGSRVSDRLRQSVLVLRRCTSAPAGAEPPSRTARFDGAGELLRWIYGPSERTAPR